MMEEDQNSSDGDNNRRRINKSSYVSTQNNLKKVRQRSTLACDTCRARRTKCDGRKPICSFCDDHDIPCLYRQPPSPGPSKHDMEITAIKERLDHICNLLPVRLETNARAAATQPPFGSYPMDESIISRSWRMEFPFMTVQTPSTLILLGLDPLLAAQLVTVERTDVSSLTPPEKSIGFRFEYRSALSFFVSFCDKIHHWYPIFDPEIFDLYHDSIVKDITPSTDSCLVFLIAAIGSVTQCNSIAAAIKELPDADYIREALSMLPNAHFEFSLRSVQCFILLSIYYKCIAKPCQAHDFALIASFKAQSLFKCHAIDEDTRQLELLRRSFWSVLLIESELSYHIDMAESNIWKFDDRILLPDIHTIWNPIHNNPRATLGFIRNSDGQNVPEDVIKAYFLSEIAMCRMIRRCTTSVTLSHDQEVYAPIIAVELTHQLELWYEHLPSSIRFKRHAAVGFEPEDILHSTGGTPLTSIAVMTKYLQTQFYACLTSIYWPAVYGVIHAGSSSPLLIGDCSRFYDSYTDFVLSAAVLVPNCPIHSWCLYASLFIITMAAIEGARAPALQATITPKSIRCFMIAAEIFDSGDAVLASPSLRTLKQHLRDRLGCQP